MKIHHFSCHSRRFEVFRPEHRTQKAGIGDIYLFDRVAKTMQISAMPAYQSKDSKAIVSPLIYSYKKVRSVETLPQVGRNFTPGWLHDNSKKCDQSLCSGPIPEESQSLVQLA